MVDESQTTPSPGLLQRIAIGKHPRRTLTRLIPTIALGVIAIVVFSFVILPIRINGPSMYPTFDDGRINFVNQWAYLHSEPHRGDVVAIRFSQNHVMYVKRIVGLPGEKFNFSDGRIYINDQPLDEPYLYLPSRDWNSRPRVLGPEEYYVVGDNRSMPYENHDKGGAERKRIIGKVILGGKPWNQTSPPNQ